MFKHYIKIALRNLLTQRFYSLINVTGLAVGLASCIIILLYIGHELGYDRHYSDAERIYRVVLEDNARGVKEKYAVTTTPLAESIEREFPEIERAARIAPEIYQAGTNLVRIEGEDLNRYEEGFIYADPAFVEIFQFPIVKGDLSSALTQPYSVVLTESKARQLFADAEALGQPLILNNDLETPLTVTAVIEDLASNTHLQFDYLISMEGMLESKIPNWNFGNFVTYLKLAPEANPRVLETKIPEIIAKYRGTEEVEADRLAGFTSRYVLQPIADIHLHPTDIEEYWSHGDIQYMAFWSNRRVHFGYCMYQFHEPVHRPFLKPGKRDRVTKSLWLLPKAVDCTIPDRIHPGKLFRVGSCAVTCMAIDTVLQSTGRASFTNPLGKPSSIRTINRHCIDRWLACRRIPFCFSL